MGTNMAKGGPLLRVGGDDVGSEDMDTVSLKRLPVSCDFEATIEMAGRAGGGDPYSSAPAPARARERRGTLDDMRMLDQETKQSRPAQQAPSRTGKPKRSISEALRGTLARWVTASFVRAKTRDSDVDQV